MCDAGSWVGACGRPKAGGASPLAVLSMLVASFSLRRSFADLCVSFHCIVSQLQLTISHIISKRRWQTARLYDGPGKINQKIDLDSPKVATMDTVEAGGKKVYCRCWQSGTFPLCDGSHMAHNKETGDNVGPLIVSVAKEE